VSATQGLTTSFKVEILNGYHAFSSAYRTADSFYIALYTPAATLNASTTVYSTVGEAFGGSYLPGGQILVPTAPQSSGTGTVAYLSFAPVNWTGSISANCALIYNASQGNRSVCVLNFGGTKTSNTLFPIVFPTNDANNAVVRVV
jgi:hypothetical protein